MSTLKIEHITNIARSGEDLSIDTSGNVGIGTATPGDKLAVAGNIAVTGTVDGRDVAADGTKLDGIEASATADQTKSDIEGLGIDVPAANLTGTIVAARLSTATTQAESDDSTKIATTAYVVDKITTLIGGAPSTLNDLNELAAAINDDANYNSTLTTALATKLPLAGGTMTGELGIGVTPGAWSANYPALQIGQGATFTGHASNTQTQLGQNWWIGTGNQYVVDGAASRMIMNPDSTIIFSQAPSGTAGATMSTTHNRLVIDPNGNVGIGTGTPQTLLHVEKSSTALYTSSMSGLPSYTPSDADMIQVRNSNTGLNDIYAGIWFETGTGATNTTGTDRAGRIALVVDNDSSYSANFVFQTRGTAGTLTEKMRITQDGNVGVGNTAPKARMHIGTLAGGDGTAQEQLRLSGDYTATGSGALLRFTNQHPSGTNPSAAEYNLAGIQGFDFRSDWGGALALQTAPNTLYGGNLTTRLLINPEGLVGIGNDNPNRTLSIKHTSQAEIGFKTGSVSDGALIYYNDAEDQLLLRAQETSDSITFQTGGGGSAYERMRINNAGNVGIGVTAPIAKLDILGTGISNAPTINITTTSSSSFNHVINAMNPNLTENEGNLIVLGKAASTKNSGWLGYRYSADASDNNIISLGHWGNNWLLNVKGDGNVGIGTTAPTKKLDVVGGADYNTRFKSASSRSGFVIESPTSTQVGSGLVLSSDGSFRLGTNSYYHQQMFQTGVTQVLGGGNVGINIDTTGRATTPVNPAFRARAKTGQVYASGWQKVLYDGSVTTRGTGYANSRFTAPVDGWYQFNAQWNADNNSDVDGTFSFWINGSASDLAASVSAPNTGPNYDGHSIAGCCYLAATHYVEAYRYSTVSNTTRTSNPYGGWFSGFLIG